MSKINIPTVSGGFNLSQINSNFDQIEQHLNDRVLYRDVPTGEPNQMVNDLDMDSYRIYNLPEPIQDHEPLRKVDADKILDIPKVFHFQPPVIYTEGLNITNGTFTVDYQGVIYYPRPSYIPFTTGTWNPAQWSPVQNTYPGNELLVFDDYASASTAAATLPDGQVVVDKDQYVSYMVVAGALTNPKPVNPYTTAGGITKSVQIKLDEFENSVLDFGYGISGFQGAIDALPARGGTIFVPSGDYSALDPSTLTTSGKVLRFVSENGAILPAKMPGSVVSVGDDYLCTGWSGDSARPQRVFTHLLAEDIPTPDAPHVDSAYMVKANILDDPGKRTGTREFAAYMFDVETDNQGTASVARGLRGTVRAKGGQSTARAIRVMAEGTNGHTGELTGVLSTVIHTDLNTANPAPYNPVSGTAFQAELGAGSVRGFLATGWPGQARPSYGFVSGTGARAILPEIAHFSAHGGGNGDMFNGFVSENSADVSYSVDNKGRQAARAYNSGKLTINDDNRVTITPPASVGFLEVWTTSAASQVYGKAFFKAAASPFNTNCYKGTGLTWDTQALSGTTGVDGQVTISAKADGTIDIENRSGAARTFVLMFLCESTPSRTFKVSL